MKSEIQWKNYTFLKHLANMQYKFDYHSIDTEPLADWSQRLYSWMNYLFTTWQCDVVSNCITRVIWCPGTCDCVSRGCQWGRGLPRPSAGHGHVKTAPLELSRVSPECRIHSTNERRLLHVFNFPWKACLRVNNRDIFEE